MEGSWDSEGVEGALLIFRDTEQRSHALEPRRDP